MPPDRAPVGLAPPAYTSEQSLFVDAMAASISEAGPESVELRELDPAPGIKELAPKDEEEENSRCSQICACICTCVCILMIYIIVVVVGAYQLVGEKNVFRVVGGALGAIVK